MLLFKLLVYRCAQIWPGLQEKLDFPAKMMIECKPNCRMDVIHRKGTIMKRLQAMFLVLILGLVGCASSSDPVTGNFAESGNKACFNVRNFKYFDAIDDQHIYVRGRGKQKHFLFTLDPGCFELRYALTIGVQNTLTSVCSNRFDKVVYRDLGKVSKSCRIRYIEEAASKDAVKKLVEDRKAKKTRSVARLQNTS